MVLAIGHLPSQVRAVLSVLLQKKGKSGCRLIALFPALYRLILKASQPSLRQWAQQQDNSFYNFTH
eukprot:3929320-Lingulodinium_polyedra.AAC.1